MWSFFFLSLPFVWVAIVAAIALICWWLWFLINY